MADIDQQRMSIYEDPKKIREQIKQERKKLKAQEKQQLKEFRKKAREIDDREAQYDYTGGGFASFVLTALIVVMWLLIMALLVRLDVGGFGSTVMAPIIRDVPYLNHILPESSRGTAVRDIGAASADNEYVKRLEEQLAEAKKLNEENAETVAQLQAEVERLKGFEEASADVETKRNEWYNEVLYSDKAPDISAYISWYESIDADAAAELYKEAVRTEAQSEVVKTYAQAYSSMKPQAAAGIFNEMAANGSERDLALAARILLQMSPADRGKILGKMDAANASKLTQLMEPDSLPDL